MDQGYEALMKNNTWVLVPYKVGMNVVDNKWVFKVKRNLGGTIQRYKDQLVTKGFQQTPRVDYFETFILEVKASTIQVVLTLPVTNNRDIQQLNVNNTFLNGELQEEVYMHQPVGYINPFKVEFVCKLTKALYGLKQAP